jgi:hypothetical protein
MRTCWRSCKRISSRPRSRSTSTEIQLIETEQRTRLREDALGEIVHAPRTLKLDACLEHAREGPALGLHRITMRTDAVEAQHEQQHQACEQPEHRHIAGVVEHRRENAGRHEDQIRERITRRDDAPDFTSIEAEEQHHQNDVDGLRGQRHRDERRKVRREQSCERVSAATGEVDIAREHEHERGHRGVVDSA